MPADGPTFRRVTLPLIMPGVSGGALLALTISLDDVVVTSFVTGPGSTTLPVYVFGLVRRGGVAPDQRGIHGDAGGIDGARAGLARFSAPDQATGGGRTGGVP